jgi:hypothetical protein
MTNWLAISRDAFKFSQRWQNFAADIGGTSKLLACLVRKRRCSGVVTACNVTITAQNTASTTTNPALQRSTRALA